MLDLRIEGWRRHRVGEQVHFIAPEGPDCGLLKLAEREPLGPMFARFEETPHRRLTAAPILLVTSEGECGSVFVYERLDSAGRLSARVAAGSVIGDNFMSVVSLATNNVKYFPRNYELLLDVMRRLPLWLGIRRRLVLYRQPDGWHGVARNLDAYWHHPEFPRNPARIVVFPAVPSTSDTIEDILVAVTANRGQSAGTEEVQRCRTGLVFVLSKGYRETCADTWAVARDENYVYAALLLDGDVASGEVFRTLLEDVQPIQGKSAPHHAMDHWAH